MRRWFRLGSIAAAGVAASVAIAIAGQSAPLSVQDAVALYARGEFDAAVLLDTRELRVAPFTRALDDWIAAGDAAGLARRRLTAAAFALDATWASTRMDRSAEMLGDGSGRIPPISAERETLVSHFSQPLVAQWAVRQLPSAGSPDAVGLERLLWLAAVGIAEDGRAWRTLQRELLPRARKRWPGEPRLSLADAIARTNLDVGLMRNVVLRRADVLRVESPGTGVSGRIPGAIRSFEPLLADRTLAGEAELRIGYLELRRKRWPAALTRFDATRSKTTEPTLLAAADYFAGWAFEQQDQADDAITAYRRALAITPTMRNLATRLAALLYLRNERAEAYAALDRALNAEPAPMDLLLSVERADARFVPGWIEEIREALK